jgi:hypothetical protein
MNRVATPARPQPTLAWRLIRSLGYLSPIRFGFGAGDNFAHDPLDRSSTAPASYGAAEATIDLLCTERLLPLCRYHVPNLVVTQYIA